MGDPPGHCTPSHRQQDPEGPNAGRVDTNEAIPSTTEQDDANVSVSNPKTKRNMPNKINEALMLPTCMNLNPRSVYNKSMELVTFIKEEQVYCVFISESWERPEFDLSKLIDIEDFTVISNPHQRQGQGGRPALIINTKYYGVRNLTNSLISIPWGCEATWALMSPKHVKNQLKYRTSLSVASIANPTQERKEKSSWTTKVMLTMSLVPSTKMGSIS